MQWGDFVKDLQISLLFDYYAPCISQKQQDIFDLYYNEDLSLAEVAESAKISRQGVRDSVKRTEHQLIELENQLHIVQSAQELKKLANDVKSGKSEINDLLKYIENL